MRTFEKLAATAAKEAWQANLRGDFAEAGKQAGRAQMFDDLDAEVVRKSKAKHRA
jgi:hypothetical protein